MQHKADNFPKPKFFVGQRVYLRQSYTLELDRSVVYIPVQTTLSCISVLRRLKDVPEPFNYDLILESDIGGDPNILQNVRESFIEAAE